MSLPEWIYQDDDMNDKCVKPSFNTTRNDIWKEGYKKGFLACREKAAEIIRKNRCTAGCINSDDCDCTDTIEEDIESLHPNEEKE